MANTNKIMTTKEVTVPGKALWTKVNTEIDEVEGKRYSVINLVFDKENQAAMKKKVDQWLDEAKAAPEFKGKTWRKDEDRRSYFEQEDGTLVFRFRTMAFYTDKSGEEKRRFIPLFNEYGKRMGNDIGIGNDSIVQVRYDVGAYWNSKDGNGINLYLTGILVKELIEYTGGNDNGDGFEFKAAPEATEVLQGKEDDNPFA